MKIEFEKKLILLDDYIFIKTYLGDLHKEFYDDMV